MINSPQPQEPHPDHGGNLDAACLEHGGTRADWIDLSTGINPVPYSLGPLPSDLWTALPDLTAQNGLISAARSFWSVPCALDILPTNGASAAIAALPDLFDGTAVDIPCPTYNEHARAFTAAGWTVNAEHGPHDARVIVHPNNPDGRLWSQSAVSPAQLAIDESFADCMDGCSLLPHISNDQQVVLKSFGKFWGLAGLRLGFVIAAPNTIARLKARLGPWSVSGPALAIGTNALNDIGWARKTRLRLQQDASRLDALMAQNGNAAIGGTPLFRLYYCDSAHAKQNALAQSKIWSRTFPYDPHWLRLGLPAPTQWDRLEAALIA